MNRQTSAKIKRKMWDATNMEEALEAVRKKKVSIRQASRTFNVPLTTLSDRVAGRVTRDTPGPDPVLTKDEENRLAEWIIRMNNIGHDPTRVQICDTVKQILDTNKRPNPFIDNLPGRGWYASFSKRHPEVREWYRSSTYPSTPTSRKKLDKWFKEYQETVSRLGIGDKPHLIWNCGEFIFPLEPDMEWATNSSSGLFQGEKDSSRKSKKMISTLCAISAAGAIVPPSYVFQKIYHSRGDAVPCAYQMQHPSGRMESQVFQLWLTSHFTEHAPNERPILVLFSGYSSFIDKPTKASALDNEIEFLCLPPHLVRQPIEDGLFSALKIDWLRNIEDFKGGKVHKKIRAKDFPSIFKNTWEDSVRLSNIFDGFRNTGIFPQNRDLVCTAKKPLESNGSSHIDIPNLLVSKAVVLKALEEAMPAIQVELFEKRYARGFQNLDPLYLTWKNLKLKVHSMTGVGPESSSESSSDSDEESSSEEEEEEAMEDTAPLVPQNIETAAYEEVQSQGYHNVIRLKRKRKEMQNNGHGDAMLGDEVSHQQLCRFQVDNEEATYVRMTNGNADSTHLLVTVSVPDGLQSEVEEAAKQRHHLSNDSVPSKEALAMETDGNSILPSPASSSSFHPSNDKHSISEEEIPVPLHLQEEKLVLQQFHADQTHASLVPVIDSSPIQLSDNSIVQHDQQHDRQQPHNLVSPNITATENEAVDALVIVSMLDPESLKVLDGCIEVASAIEVVSS